MIVTIDGPAGAGKSTVARLLARRLNFEILDTGAMYRALTWAALETGIDPEDSAAVSSLADRLDLQIDQGRILTGGRDVTREIREPRVTENVSAVADHPAVRRKMIAWQRAFAAHGDYVCEGRDQGTEAFPNADVKIFLTASPTQRSLRRWQELNEAGHPISLAEIELQQTERDRRDSLRPVGALRRADDALEFNTDHLTIEEVVDRLEQLVRERLVSKSHE